MAIHHFPALVAPSIMYLDKTFANEARCWDGKNLDSPNHQLVEFPYKIAKFFYVSSGPRSCFRSQRNAFRIMWGSGS